MAKSDSVQGKPAEKNPSLRPGGTLVELHWSIFSGEWLRHTAQVGQEAIWERTTPIAGDAVRTLSPEDAVLHLCVHLVVNHQMSGIGLRTLVDLGPSLHGLCQIGQTSDKGEMKVLVIR